MYGNPQWHEAKRYFDAFWACDCIDRPGLQLSYPNGRTAGRREDEDGWRLWNDPAMFLNKHMPPGADCLGEGLRVMYPNWCGIEEMLGVSLFYDPETIWVHPLDGGLEAIDFTKASMDKPPVARLIELLTYCAKEAHGEWFMGLPPMGNAGDTIARMRSYGAY